MKYSVFIPAIALLFASAAYATPPIEGTYDCDDCNGLLEIKKDKTDIYSVSVVVGSGSCGGEVVTKGRSQLVAGNKLEVPHKSNKKACLTTISLDEKGAVVTDSCYKTEDEANSTCTTLGKYSKR